jgi:SanA protein
MKLKPVWKRVGLALATATIALGAALAACDFWVARVAQGRCFSSLDLVPQAPVGLVLGCSERLRNGRRNLYFDRRIAAAAELFHSGRVRALIASGDNQRADYDEPSSMKAALVRAGVPEQFVTCDFAGFSTLDSVLRARDVFGQSRIVVVSQRFHAERAVFIAREHGIDVYSFDAAAVGGAVGLKLRPRESAARVAAVLDVALLNTEPKFRGPSVDVELAALQR